MATGRPSRAGGPQPLFSPNSSTRTHPISFSTSDAMRPCLKTVRTGSLPHETPSGSLGRVTPCAVAPLRRRCSFGCCRFRPQRTPTTAFCPREPLPAGSVRRTRPRDPRPTSAQSTPGRQGVRRARSGTAHSMLVSFSILIPNALSSFLFFCAHRLLHRGGRASEGSHRIL